MKKLLSSNMALRASMAVLVVALVVAVVSLFRIPTKLVMAVDGFDLNKTTGVTIGRQSDVCIDNVPAGYLTVSHNAQDGSFGWQVNARGEKDTLQYYLINDVNPNRHALRVKGDSLSSIQVRYGRNRTFTLTGAEVKEVYKGLDTHYIQLSNAIRKVQGEVADCLMADKLLRSFLYHDDDGYYLVILDRMTMLDGKVGYCFGGNTADAALMGSAAATLHHDELKVQFFRLSTSAYRDKKVDDSTFSIDDLNYTMKPTVKLTPWQAGHVMLRARGDRLEVRFPKAVMYVESVGKVRERCHETGNMLSYMQDSRPFPSHGTIYLPAFSHGMEMGICTVDFNDEGIVLRDNTNQSYPLGSHFSLWGPQLTSYQLHSGSGTIHARVGLLGGRYLASYLALPFVALLLILVAIRMLFCYSNRQLYDDNHPRRFYSAELIRSFAPLAKLLMCAAFCMVVCKVMITVKLGYTYPYFEKVSHIAPVTTTLFLVMVWALILLVNHRMLRLSTHRVAIGRSGWLIRSRRLLIALASVALPAALAYVSLRYNDGHNARLMLESYFPQNLWSLNVMRWPDLTGINDTHRSVPYTQFLMLGVVVVLLLALSLFPGFFTRCGHWMRRQMSRWGNCLLGLLAHLLPRLADGLRWLIRHRTDPLYDEGEPADRPWWHVFRATGLHVLYHGVPYLFLLLLLWALPGNYATALITLVVVFGLSHAYTSFTEYELRHHRFFVLLTMITHSVLFLLMAFMPDHGYLTNYIGFAATLIVLFFSYKSQMRNQREQRRENAGIRLSLLAFIAFGFILLRFILPQLADTDSFDRSNRRISLSYSYDEVLRSGYRFSESDAEFMTVMAGYMTNVKFGDEHHYDPLSNESNYLHPSVATGQSPVILNDLSIQSSFFHAYGGWAYITFFCLLIALALAVMWYSYGIDPDRGSAYVMHPVTARRLLAMMMWVGTSAYLLSSYFGILPFTGRLNPGYGIDSVGEALESALLLALMCGTVVDAPSGEER